MIKDALKRIFGSADRIGFQKNIKDKVIAPGERSLSPTMTDPFKTTLTGLFFWEDDLFLFSDTTLYEGLCFILKEIKTEDLIQNSDLSESDKLVSKDINKDDF